MPAADAIHCRTAIFTAVVGALAAIDGFGGSGKVARGRTAPVPVELLPAITITWSDHDEQATLRPFARADGSPGYDRALPISIIVHYAASDPETVFDQNAVQIEAAMATLVDGAGAEIEMVLQSSRLFVDQRTGMPIGAGRLVYLASYKTLASDPSIAAI